MAKSPNQKLKLLHLLRILTQETDERHPMGITAMIDELEKRGISAERKSIYDDLEALRMFGVDIIMQKTSGGTGYYIGSREFELAELKLLVDSVQTSKFITHKKSYTLIKKLESLCSRHEAGLLQGQVYVANRIKTMNESIYYNVDKLHTAIAEDKQINFKYFDYLVSKERVFRHGGREYCVSPFALTWDDENYYMVAFDSADQKIKHYRVDKMTAITLRSDAREGKAQFEKLDPAVYSKKLFGMFAGDLRTVGIRFANRLVSMVIDRFGPGVPLVPQGDSHFIAEVEVAVSPQFFAWVVGFGSEAQIVAPPDVAAQMGETLKGLADLYR